MARIKLKIASKFETLEGVTRRVKAGLQGPAFEIVKRAAERTADEEFSRGAFAQPQGGFKAWKPRHPLSKKRGPLLGGVGGSIRRSWQIRPTGRFRVVFASRHPGAAVHRGSARGGPRETTTRIMPKRFDVDGRPLMWRALARKGIFMSPAKLARRGVVVPSRPHLGPSRRLRRRVNQGLRRFLITGR